MGINILSRIGKGPIILLFGLLIVGLLIGQVQALTSSKGNHPGPAYTPSKEFQTWSKAPAITQEQKTRALNALNSSDTFNKYMKYPHGPISFMWAYPYTGEIHGSAVINSSEYYGLLSFNVDNGTVSNVDFNNWRNYW